MAAAIGSFCKRLLTSKMVNGKFIKAKRMPRPPKKKKMEDGGRVDGDPKKKGQDIDWECFMLCPVTGYPQDREGFALYPEDEEEEDPKVEEVCEELGVEGVEEEEPATPDEPLDDEVDHDWSEEAKDQEEKDQQEKEEEEEPWKKVQRFVEQEHAKPIQKTEVIDVENDWAPPKGKGGGKRGKGYGKSNRNWKGNWRSLPYKWHGGQHWHGKGGNKGGWRSDWQDEDWRRDSRRTEDWMRDGSREDSWRRNDGWKAGYGNQDGGSNQHGNGSSQDGYGSSRDGCSRVEENGLQGVQHQGGQGGHGQMNAVVSKVSGSVHGNMGGMMGQMAAMSTMFNMGAGTTTPLKSDGKGGWYLPHGQGFMSSDGTIHPPGEGLKGKSRIRGGTKVQQQRKHKGHDQEVTMKLMELMEKVVEKWK